MFTADLAFEADFDGWRQAARAAYSRSVRPEDLAFTIAGAGETLFAETLGPHDPDGPQPSVPASHSGHSNSGVAPPRGEGKTP